MTRSKADRPYGNFPRHGLVPEPEPEIAAAAQGRRARVRRWLRARSRRERVELAITAILVFAAIFISISALPKGVELGTVRREEFFAPENVQSILAGAASIAAAGH